MVLTEMQNNEKKLLGSSETLKVFRRKVRQTLRKLTHDFEQFEFNAIISSFMELEAAQGDCGEGEVGEFSCVEDGE
jgi:leucyl-tRNA synthetase